MSDIVLSSSSESLFDLTLSSSDSDIELSSSSIYTHLSSSVDNDIEKGLPKHKEDISEFVDIVPFKNKTQSEFDRELKKSKVKLKTGMEKLLKKQNELASSMLTRGYSVNDIIDSSELNENQIIEAYLQHKN